MSHFANCSGFSETQLTILTGLRGGFSAAACVASVTLLIVTCACQSKLGFGERDKCLKIGVFALFGVSISYLTVLSLGLVYHLLPASSGSKWCEAFGFLDQILSVCQITLLFINTRPIVAFLWSEITRGREQTICCKKNWIAWGLMSTVIALAGMILISSCVAPFVTETYGEVCVWCWIFSIDKDCKVIVAGFLEQLFLWIIYQMLISLMCIVMILTSVILFLKACAYRVRQYSNLDDGHDYKHLFLKYIFQLIILVPVLIDFADIVVKPHTHHYGFSLWVYYSVAPPISGLLIPLSFLLYIKFFGYTGSSDNTSHVSINQPLRQSTAGEQWSPFSDSVFVTARTGNSDSTGQVEGQSLLEGRGNMQYNA